jgi:nucleotide-binding universal stress UspA family protein
LREAVRCITATLTHFVGDPAAEIARLAETGRFDLVVMGSHGHGSLARIALGSVTTKVLAKCSRPVLIVR